MIIGKTRRKSYPNIFARSFDFESKDLLLPWVLDEAIGVYLIDFEKFKITFPFQWADERIAMKTVSFVFAEGKIENLKDLLSAVLNEIKGDREIALDLIRWFEENLDMQSSLVVEVAVCNLGQLPFLISGEAELNINLPGEKPKKIKLLSESYGGSEINIDRIVAHLKWVEKQLDTPLPAKEIVPVSNILIAPNSQLHITFRTITNFAKLDEGKTLLNLYKSEKLKARLSVSVYYPNGKLKLCYSPFFHFKTHFGHRRHRD